MSRTWYKKKGLKNLRVKYRMLFVSRLKAIEYAIN